MEQDTNITVKDFLRAFVQRLPRWIALSVAVFLVVVAGECCVKDRLVITARLNFSYDGIESGRDPAGNRFDEQEIKDEARIRAAAQSMERGLSDEDVETLRDALEVRSVVPENAFQRVIEYQSIYQEEEVEKRVNVRDGAWFPSQYAVVFHYAKAGFSPGQGAVFLKELLAAYEQYFYSRFGYNDSLEQAVSSIDYGEYDYINAVDVLQNRLSSLRSYLSALAVQDNTRFVSSQTGYSFSDLTGAIDAILNEDISWITSYIITNNITKDRQDLIDYYLYKIKDAEREITQRQSRLQTLNAQIESYVKTNAIFLGVVDPSAREDASSSGYEFSQQSAMYDALINEKISYETAISETQERISLYQGRVERLQSGVASGSPDVVESGLKRLDDKVTQFLADTRQTSDEFFRTVWLERAVQVLTEPKSQFLSVNDLLQDSFPVVLIAEAVLFGLTILSLFKAVRAKADAPDTPEEEEPSGRELSMEGNTK